MFRCVELGKEMSYLEHDFAIQCGSGGHSQLVALAITGLVVFGIGIPAWLFIELYRNRGHLHDKSHDKYHLTRFRLGDFFKTYEPDWFYWEVVVVFEKALLVGMLGAIEQYSPTQLMVGSFMCIVYTLLVLRVAPYESDQDDWLAFLCTLSLTITYVAGILVALDERNTNDEDRVLDTEQVSITLVVTNIVPLAFFVYSVMVVVRDRGMTKSLSRTPDEPKPPQQYAGSSVLPVTTTAEKEEDTAITRPGVGRTASCNSIADSIMEHHDAHARDHALRQQKRSEKARRKTQQRVEARARLKKSAKMKNVEIFRSLDDKSLYAVIDKMKPRTFQAGEAVLRQGDDADAFFVITDGACVVKRKTLVDPVNGQVIGHLGVFQHFGEAALTTAARRVFLRKSGMSGTVQAGHRNASVLAGREGVSVLRLSAADLEEVLESGAVDLTTVKASIEAADAAREALTSVRRVWVKSETRARLQARQDDAEGALAPARRIAGRSLFNE